MTMNDALHGFISRAARGLRRRTGWRTDLDYRRWYSTWDLQRDYWTIVGPTTKEEYDRLSAVKRQLLVDLGLTPEAKILDVGCGTGQLTAALHDFLSDRGHYCGTDISPEAVAFCRSRFRRPNFSFLTSDMTALPLHNISFDFIVFFSVFTHTYPQETALLLCEAHRLLAEGGVIFADLFADPLVDRHAGDRTAVMVNPDYLQSLLDGNGLHAELVEVQPGPQSGQRLFYKFTRIPLGVWSGG
ncbi:MAG TPA: methyltransferase domain-containing protein [Gemmataceae bacterium]|nr:methyltransferase domain-containing protein [Gemmataceae bacterium]